MKQEFRVRLPQATRINLLAFILLATTTGCTGLKHWSGELHGCISNHMVDYSNRALAERAWIKRKERFCKYQYQQEFKDGFITGYLDVANGGDGCTPTIAPRKYWGWAYQTPHGQAATSNFFQGFPFGAKAAEEDGIGYWTAIPTSGLDVLVPYSQPASDNTLPVPAPVIESGSVSANTQLSQINKPITSPSDESSAGRALELPESSASNVVTKVPTPANTVLPPASRNATEFHVKEKEVADKMPMHASTENSPTELSFTFE